MENYYFITGVALINVQFPESLKWYKPNEKFTDELVKEKHLEKYSRFLKIEKKELAKTDELNLYKNKTVSKTTKEVETKK